MALLLLYLNGITLGLTAILVFFYFYKRWSKSAKTKAAPEAGGAWPIIGHLPLLAGRELPHIALAALVDEYGPIFTIRIGIFPALVVNSWELAKELFTINDAVVSTRPKFTSAKLLGHNFVNFGFAPYGEFWREMRKVVASELLSNRRLELLKGIRADEVEGSIKDLFKFWEKSKDGNNQALIEMKKWFNDINMNVILRMVAGKRYFGISDAGDEEEAHRFQKAAREFFHLAGVYVLRDAFPLLGWMDFGGYEKAMKKTAKEFDTIIGGWLEEHRRKRDIGEVGDKDKDFIDVLMLVLDGINLSGYDPDTVRKATTVTLIAGGTDTTTVSVTWALVLLLNHPVALRKTQEELDIQVGKERLVNESDMNKLVYLQAIIKETLRLYPVGSLLAREFTEDCTVSSYHIPAGTRLLVNLHTIHRDPRVWSNPTKFEPERFLSAHKEIDVKGQNFELIPFGGGRRICPGMNFGIVMTQLLLASFLQAFDISTPSNEAVDMRATPGLTNSKATPLQVMFKPRLPAYLYERS